MPRADLRHCPEVVRPRPDVRVHGPIDLRHAESHAAALQIDHACANRQLFRGCKSFERNLIKYALKQAGIIESDEVRLPLGQISGEARAILDPLLFELELT